MSEPQSQVQMSFGNGPNPAGAPHLLADGEVASATNIDFSYEPGAAACRRGSAKTWTIDGANPVRKIYRRFTSSYATGPFYVHCGSAIYRGTSGTFTALMSGLSGSRADITSYQGQAFIAAEMGTNAIKNNGTSVTDWIKQAPAVAPGLTPNAFWYSLRPANGTWTWTVVEGSATGTKSATAVVLGAAGEGVLGTSSRLQVNFGSLVSTNLGTGSNFIYGTYSLGDYGVNSIRIGFSNPAAVTRITRDYSIGDTTFGNYWHHSYVIGEKDTLDSIATEVTGHELLMSYLTRIDRANPRTAELGWAINAKYDIRTPQREFTFVGTGTTINWSNIQAARLIVEATDPAVVVTADSWAIQGGEPSSLDDTEVGYTYWETWATLDTSGNVLGESAPSPASIRTKISHGHFVVYETTTPTGSHGITHRLFYRQGGLTTAPYRVLSLPLATNMAADYMTDLTALSSGIPMESVNNLSRSQFPNNIVAISEPWYERIFVGHENIINWSLPGMPDCFPTDSVADVSQTGDGVQGFAVWPPGLVIVNRDSVYEMHGNTFEGGPETADWKLERTGSRHGNIAPATIIKTPAGIPLFDNDGIYIYVPGQGIDLPLDWVMDKIGDAWQGPGSTDPAASKGSRVPAINKSYSDRCCAAWHNNKLYFGAPTGVSTYCSTLFVMDFATKRVWWYTYPWYFTCLTWDGPNNALYAGTSDGYVMQLDTGSCDQNTAGADVVTTWSVKTRQWTTPSETVLENLSIEYQGGNAIVYGLYDATTTQSLGTLTNSGKTWTTPKLAGTICNNAAFLFSGIQTKGTQNVLYNLTWDALY